MQRTLRDVRKIRLSAALAEEPEVELALVWPRRGLGWLTKLLHSPPRSWMEGRETRRPWSRYPRNLSPALQAGAPPPGRSRCSWHPWMW